MAGKFIFILYKNHMDEFNWTKFWHKNEFKKHNMAKNDDDIDVDITALLNYPINQSDAY
jgi:hypothetical protein